MRNCQQTESLQILLVEGCPPIHAEQFLSFVLAKRQSLKRRFDLARIDLHTALVAGVEVVPRLLWNILLESLGSRVDSGGSRETRWESTRSVVKKDHALCSWKAGQTMECR